MALGSIAGLFGSILDSFLGATCQVLGRLLSVYLFRIFLGAIFRLLVVCLYRLLSVCLFRLLSVYHVPGHCTRVHVYVCVCVCVRARARV